MNWISVNDSLPDWGEHVLVYISKDQEQRVAWVTEESYGFAWRQYYGWTNTFEVEDVTHWRPLPEAPEEE